MTTAAADTRALDAAYKPFPPFAEWQARTSVESARWSALVTRLNEAREAATTLTSRALEVAKRAAAFDTGALENLYETDRGFTYSVAFETGAWELGLLERGEQVRPLFEAQMHAYDFVLRARTGGSVRTYFLFHVCGAFGATP